MRPPWPEETTFRRLVLDVEGEQCEHCGANLHVCDHRFHRIHTLQGPVELLCRLAHCSDCLCPLRCQTLSPAAELSLPRPWWTIGWEVFCWMLVWTCRPDRVSVQSSQVSLDESTRLPYPATASWPESPSILPPTSTCTSRERAASSPSTCKG